MSKPTPITTPLLRRILPGLRMMARFPSRPVQDVSFMTEVELSELKAYLAEHPAPTDDAVKLLEYHLDKSEKEGIAPPWAGAAELEPAVVQKLPSSPAVQRFVAAAASARSKPSIVLAAQGSKAARDAIYMPKYRAIATELCANPWLKENTACKAQGVAAGTWCGFKKRVLGQTRGLDREALRKYFDLPPLPLGGPQPPRAAIVAAELPALREVPSSIKVVTDRLARRAARDKTPEEIDRVSKPIERDSARNAIGQAESGPASQKLSLTAPGFSQPFTIRITLELIPSGGAA